MQVKEYRVVKEPNYGAPVLKVAHTYETQYNGEPCYASLAEMMDELFNLSYLNEEYMYVISMDTSFHIKGIYELAHGDHHSVRAYNRELYTFLLLSGAEQFIVVHNHPNGFLGASESDKKWTLGMNICANILHLKFSEHIIVTEDGYAELGIKTEADETIVNNINWDEIDL